jgi:hypothetical protein
MTTELVKTKLQKQKELKGLDAYETLVEPFSLGPVGFDQFCSSTHLFGCLICGPIW